jgi:hypothetical protein
LNTVHSFLDHPLVLVSLADRAVGLMAHDHPPWQTCPNTAYNATTLYMNSDSLSLSTSRFHVAKKDQS